MSSEQELNRTKEQLKTQEAINAAKQKQAKRFICPWQMSNGTSVSVPHPSLLTP